MSTSSSNFEIQMNDIVMSKETKSSEEAVEKEAKVTENAVEQPKEKLLKKRRKTKGEKVAPKDRKV